MKTIQQKDLKRILENHAQYLRTWDVALKGDLSDTDLEGIDFSGMNLEGMNFQWSNLNKTNLRGANLRGTNFSWATCSDANATFADFSCANLTRADFSRTKLDNADIRSAVLRGTTFENTSLVGCKRLYHRKDAHLFTAPPKKQCGSSSSYLNLLAGVLTTAAGIGAIIVALTLAPFSLTSFIVAACGALSTLGGLAFFKPASPTTLAPLDITQKRSI